MELKIVTPLPYFWRCLQIGLYTVSILLLLGAFRLMSLRRGVDCLQSYLNFAAAFLRF